MMKKITLILTTFLIVLSCSVDISNAEKKYVFDKSDLLSNSTIEQLEENADLYSTSDEYGFDMVVVTTNDSKGKDVKEYADDYYDNLIDKKGYSEDGILLLIAMDIREIAISTSGDCIDYFDYEELDTMVEGITYDLANEDYDDACEYFSEKCGNVVSSYKNFMKSQELYNQDTVDNQDKSEVINQEENINQSNVDENQNNQSNTKEEMPKEETKPRYFLIAACCIVPSMIISGIITICQYSDKEGYYSDDGYYVKDSKSVPCAIIKSDFIIKHSNDNLEFDHIYETVIKEPEKTEPKENKPKATKPKPKKTKYNNNSERTQRSYSRREHGGASDSFDRMEESSSEIYESSSEREHGGSSGSF